MIFASLLKNFIQDHRAAVTVDWVVLTAALVVVAIAVVAIIQTGLDTTATVITGGISTAVVSALS